MIATFKLRGSTMINSLSKLGKKTITTTERLDVKRCYTTNIIDFKMQQSIKKQTNKHMHSKN